MKSFTNRHAGLALLGLTCGLLIYVVASDWAFVEMRDGTRIGSFPLAFLGLCLIFAVLITMDREESQTPLAAVRELTFSGAFKIVAFMAGGLLLAFYHERFGFAALCIPFLILTSLFMGQRRPQSMALYAVAICLILFGLLRALDFDLSLLPNGFGV